MTILTKAIRQTAGIIVFACILAAFVNLVRGNGIAFVGDWSAESRVTDDSGQSLLISLKKASRMYVENKAVFVDARPESEYKQGHIKSAVSLPWRDADERFMEVASRLEEAGTIIIYCDGKNCELSHDLARFLSDMGFEKVRVLINGWTVWQKAGLPTQKDSPEYGQAGS